MRRSEGPYHLEAMHCVFEASNAAGAASGRRTRRRRCSVVFVIMVILVKARLLP